jgi:hypothetical protein
MGEGMMEGEVQDMRMEGGRVAWSHMRSGITVLASDGACWDAGLVRDFVDSIWTDELLECKAELLVGLDLVTLEQSVY